MDDLSLDIVNALLAEDPAAQARALALARPLQEVAPGLWLGNLAAAKRPEMLRALGIHSVLSVLDGALSVHPTFVTHRIYIDDDEDADLLAHLGPAIAFIQAELDRGHGVLVHCLGGISRSATVVAAYLMHARGIDAPAAIAVIRAARPAVSPNDGFLRQLDAFHRTLPTVTVGESSTTPTDKS